jgi:hypothetical protein
MKKSDLLVQALLVLATACCVSGSARPLAARSGSDASLSGRAGSAQVRRIKADTGGRGVLNGRDSVPVTRAYFETIGEPSVALSDERDFRIRFRCQITETRDDREFRLRIIDSDRGEASGSAFVRLNHDRNEIEEMNIRGHLRGRRMDGNFTRN